jgi:hypothetical protein
MFVRPFTTLGIVLEHAVLSLRHRHTSYNLVMNLDKGKNFPSLPNKDRITLGTSSRDQVLYVVVFSYKII